MADQYARFDDGTILGPFDLDAVTEEGDPVLPRYLLDEGWGNRNFEILTKEQLPEGADVLAPLLRTVYVSLQILGLPKEGDAEQLLTGILYEHNSHGSTNSPTIYLQEITE